MHRGTVVSEGPDPSSNVVNEATVSGTDPTGETVTATADDDVDVYFPAITLTKLVDDPATPAPPAESVIVEAGTPVNYTLRRHQHREHAARCRHARRRHAAVRSPTPAPGNTPPPLLPGQTWNYSCNGVTPAGDVTNTADVTATPLNPDTGAPFVGLNPPVTATDFAHVDVINPNIELTKLVVPTVVLLGPDGAPEAVTYTFAADEHRHARAQPTGSDHRRARRRIRAGSRTRVQLARRRTSSGDTDDDDLLDPGETWTFTCPGSITATTLNIAGIIAQPSDATGAPLPGVDPVGDLALALVEVLRPGITIDKTALVGVVLDDGAVLRRSCSRRPRRAGPGLPTPRPAEYLYEVNNTGNVPLSVDPNPPSRPGRRSTASAPRSCSSRATPTRTTCSTSTRHGSTRARRRSTGTSTTPRSRSVTCRRP